MARTEHAPRRQASEKAEFTGPRTPTPRRNAEKEPLSWVYVPTSPEAASSAANTSESKHARTALALGVSVADFDRIVDPKTMVGDPQRDPGLQ
jgi:hypothetical protein